MEDIRNWMPNLYEEVVWEIWDRELAFIDEHGNFILDSLTGVTRLIFDHLLSTKTEIVDYDDRD
jgi:hypothetical protein